MECNEWVDQILREFLLLVHHVEENNFDYLRFDRHLERTFLHDYHLKHLKFFFGNQDALFATRKGLADEDSRKLFDRLILYRMLGQMHVRLPTNTPEYWEKRQQVEELPVDLAW